MNNNYTISNDDIQSLLDIVEKKYNIKLLGSNKGVIKGQFERYITNLQKVSVNVLKYNGADNNSLDLINGNNTSTIDSFFTINQNNSTTTIYYLDVIFELIKNELNHSIELYEKFLSGEKLVFNNKVDNTQNPQKGEIYFTNYSSSFHLFGMPEINDFLTIFKNYINYCKINDSKTYAMFNQTENNNEIIDTEPFLKKISDEIKILNSCSLVDDFKYTSTKITNMISNYFVNHKDQLTNSQIKELYDTISYVSSIIKANQKLIYSDLPYQISYINSPEFSDDIKKLLDNKETKGRILKIIEENNYEDLYDVITTSKINNKYVFNIFSGHLNVLTKNSINNSRVLEHIKLLNNFNIEIINEIENIEVENYTYDEWLNEINKIFSKSIGIEAEENFFDYIINIPLEQRKIVNAILTNHIEYLKVCKEEMNDETYYKIYNRLEYGIQQTTLINDSITNGIYSFKEQKENYINNGLMTDLGRLYIYTIENNIELLKKPIDMVISKEFSDNLNNLPTVAQKIDKVELKNIFDKHKESFDSDLKGGALSLIDLSIKKILNSNNQNIKDDLLFTLENLYNYINDNNLYTLYYMNYIYKNINTIIEKYPFVMLEPNISNKISEIEKSLKTRPNFLNLDKLTKIKMDLGFTLSITNYNKYSSTIGYTQNDITDRNKFDIDYLLLLHKMINEDSFKSFIEQHKGKIFNFPKVYSKLKSINSLTTISFSDIIFSLGKRRKNDDYTALVIKINNAVLELITWSKQNRRIQRHDVQQLNQAFYETNTVGFTPSSLRVDENDLRSLNDCSIVGFVPENLQRIIDLLKINNTISLGGSYANR